MKYDAEATHLVRFTRTSRGNHNALRWEESLIWEWKRDRRLTMRNGHKLGAWSSSNSAELWFLRAETFCERGARGGAEILYKRERPLGPASVGKTWR